MKFKFKFAWYSKQVQYYTRKKDTVKALHYLKKIDLAACDQNEKIQVADFFHHLGNSDEALSILNDLIKESPSASLFEKRGTIYADLHQVDQALESLNRAIELEPDSFLYWYAKGAILKDAGSYAEAIVHFKESIKRSHQSSVYSTYYELGLCYFHQEDYKKAVTVFRKITSIPEQDLPIYYYWLSLSYEALGNLDASLEALLSGRKLLEQFHSKSDRGEKLTFERTKHFKKNFQKNSIFIEKTFYFTTKLSEIYERKGNLVEAIKWLTVGIKEFPNEKEMYFYRGSAYQENEEYEKALKDIECVIKLAPDFEEAYYEKTLIHRKMNQEQLALDTLLTLSSFKEEDDLLGYFLAESHLKLGNIQEALEINQKTLRIYPTDAYQHSQHGDILVQFDQFEEADRAYTKAIHYQGLPDFYLKRSYARYWMNRPELALEDLQIASSQDETLIEKWFYYLALGQIYRELKLWQLSIEAFTTGLVFSPSNPQLYEQRALTLYDAYQLPEAIEDCQKGIEIDPMYVNLYYLKSYLHYRNQSYSESLIDALTFIKLSPDSVIGYYNLGLVYIQLNEMNQALEAFTKSITLQPDYANGYYERAYVHNYFQEAEFCIQDLVNWVLYVGKQYSLSQRLVLLDELQGLDASFIEEAKLRVETAYGEHARPIS